MSTRPKVGVVAVWLVCLAVVAVGRAADPQRGQAVVEPDYREACTWWTELRKKWTPVGWKNHVFRYNVLFNGAVVAEPNTNRRSARWAGQGVLVWPSLANPVDDGTICQGFRPDHDTPVLWTDWSGSPYGNAKASGVRLRQEIFAYVPGGQEVQTGIESLMAWVRLSLDGVEQNAVEPKKFALAYKLYGPSIGRSMNESKNLRFTWPPYPRKLSFQPAVAGARAALVEEDGRIRLAVAAQKGCRVDFRAAEKETSLEIEFDVQPSSGLDLILPMVPLAPEEIQRECALGYDKALAEADRYWHRRPATAATVEVPEEEINRAIRNYLRMAEVIAEKDPATGEYCTLTGSWTYADVWSTPNSMLPGFLLDPLGYHAEAARYLAVFAKHQGSTVPPGKAYKQHPGYLGTPKVYQAINWLSDNGALLWAFSQHALLSGDERFIETYAPAIVNSCQWIADSRKLTGHGGIEGILPAAVATDEKREVQAIWNDGWNYKGLTTAVRLLKRIRHPRAAEFEAEARDYRDRFRRAFIETARNTPTWSDSTGKVLPMPPRNLWGDPTWGIPHAFYLDCGPLFPTFAGTMDADEELCSIARQWFREGPSRKVYQDDGNHGKLPSLQHEISSCEPCYSWVYFHSWQLADRPRFLEGMYSLFAGASSQQTSTVCETRGGITGVTPCLPGVWLARLAMIDEQIRDGELHLLRLAPLAWLRSDRAARFEHMPTELGVVSLTARLDPAGRELQVTFVPDFRVAPKRIVLHVPPVKNLTTIRLNDKPLLWDGKQSTVEIQIALFR